MSTTLDRAPAPRAPSPPAPRTGTLPAKAPRKRRARGLRARLSTLRDLARHFTGTKRFFLLPMIVIFLLAAVALVIIQIVEYAAPFVYTLF